MVSQNELKYILYGWVKTAGLQEGDFQHFQNKNNCKVKAVILGFGETFMLSKVKLNSCRWIPSKSFPPLLSFK